MSENLQPAAGPVRSLDALTGLRFFAALGVFFYHAAIHIDVKSDLWAVSGAAVSFFFVLSGFILTYVYIERLPKMGVGQFYLNRWARLWPLHVFLLILVVAYRYPTEYANDTEFLGKLLANGLLIQSWLPLENWPTTFNGVAWSISTEFGFYFVFPALLLMSRRWFVVTYLALIVAIAAGLCWLNEWIHADVENSTLVFGLVYFHPFFRLLEFASGMMVGHAFLLGFHRRLERLPAFTHTFFEVAAFAAFGWFFLASIHPGFFSPRPGLLVKFCFVQQWDSAAAWLAKGAGVMPGAVLVIWVFSWSRGPLAYLLSRPFVVYLGEISFSLYMVHYIVLDQLIQLKGPSPALYFIGALFVSLGVSSLLYRLIEIPYRDGIIAAARKDFAKVWAILAGVPWTFWKNGNGVAALLAIVGGIGVLYYDSRFPVAAPAPDREVRQTTEKFAVANKGIVFQNEARLLHLDIQGTVDRGLKLKMIWETLPGAIRYRFVHVSSPDGNVLRQAKAEVKKFRDAPPSSIVLDEVDLPPELLKDGATVSIGFFSKEANAAKVESGPRSMEGYRLDVYDLTKSQPLDLSTAFK
ncbi:MAG: acyltransferase [Pirellulaceae bacterium]